MATLDEMPARFATFALEDWTGAGDDPGRAYELAHERWWAARVEWAEAAGFDAIDVMRSDRRRRGLL